MRIALISPKGPLYRYRKGIFRKSLRYMPLTLPTLTALVPAELGASVVCYDEGIQDVDLDLEADLVGMTVITGSAMRAYELAADFRARGIRVVLGGPHVTLVPDDAAPHADSIVVGYAEESWPRLLRDAAAGRLLPRYDQIPDLELTGYPLPDRSVLPESRYLTANVFEATRGCIHNCSFCVVPTAWGRKPYQKPVEAIVEDIRRRRARHAIFIDLNLIADKEYAASLFEALIPLGISWYGLSTTLLTADEALLSLAARSGCRGLLMGLESLSPAALRQTGKGFNDPSDYAGIVEALHRHRIALQGCFVFGMDDDTPEVFLRTARLAVAAKIDLPRYAILTPFPGTPLYRELDSAGRINHRDWSYYDGQHAVFRPANMTPRALEQGTEAAWKHTYSLTNMWKRLRHTAAPWPTALGTNFGYRYYAHHLASVYNCDVMIPDDSPKKAKPDDAIAADFA